MSTTAAPTAATSPRQVVLFTGHMVDAPGRAVARFPAALVPEAARRIAAALDEIDAGPADLALDPGRGRRRPAVRRSVPGARACRCGCCCRCTRASSSSSRCCRSRAAPDGTHAFAPSSPASTSRRARRRASSARSPPARTRSSAATCGCSTARSPSAPSGCAASACGTAAAATGPGGTRHLVDAVYAAGGTVLRIDRASL